MKATIETKALKEAITKLNYIPHNKSLPILSTTRIDFANGKATLHSTDLEQWIQAKVDAKSDQQCSILLPRKLTLQFLIGDNGTTNISADTTKKEVALEREGLGLLNIITHAASDFPPSLKDENLEWNTIDAKWLCKMFSIALPACATEVSRPVLTGFACKDGAMASADGFRLVKIKSDKLCFGLKNAKAIIPRQTVETAKRLFSKSKTIDIAFTNITDNLACRVYMKADGTTLISELIQGIYPDYDKLIPDKYSCKAVISAPLLLQRLNMLDTKSLPSGIVKFDIRKTKLDEDVCVISASSEGEFNYAMSLPVKFEGDASKIAFNYLYVIDAIKPFSICNLEITSPSSLGKITGDIEGLTIVIMPMFVQWQDFNN
ncbi:hypothetical protein LCGC14_0543880 [marine sediment metagenome]|uniref:DNA polymerase III beta sliding clamp central domain-containing protein n=1 Tax=marine sediment metagenome TaxID=412755 RepID=A0A0F9RWW1_9ZZZZ